jgi:hypothetical protein
MVVGGIKIIGHVFRNQWLCYRRKRRNWLHYTVLPELPTDQLTKLKLKLIYDRRSVGQSVLVSGAHLEPMTRFLFLLEISFRQLRVSYFIAPSLTRGRVCNLLVQLLLGLARAVTLGSKSRRAHDHILLSHLRLPQPGGPGSCIYIPQEQGVQSVLNCIVRRRYLTTTSDTAESDRRLCVCCSFCDS